MSYFTPYHNTSDIEGAQLRLFEVKAGNQDEMIAGFFEDTKYFGWTPSEVWQRLIEAQRREAQLQCDDQAHEESDETPYDAGPDESARDTVVVDDVASLGHGRLIHDDCS